MAARKPKTEKAYRVLQAGTTPYLETGERIYLYENALFPSNVREGEVERFLELGFIEETEVDVESVDEGSVEPEGA